MMAVQTTTCRHRSTSAILCSAKHFFNCPKKEMGGVGGGGGGGGRRKRKRKTMTRKMTMETETTDIEHDTETGILQTA